MKIHLGPGPREQKIYRERWHKWFAWKPIRLAYRNDRLDHEGRWFEVVGRRWAGDQWEYRTIDEVANHIASNEKWFTELSHNGQDDVS